MKNKTVYVISCRTKAVVAGEVKQIYRCIFPKKKTSYVVEVHPYICYETTKIYKSRKRAEKALEKMK